MSPCLHAWVCAFGKANWIDPLNGDMRREGLHARTVPCTILHRVCVNYQCVHRYIHDCVCLSYSWTCVRQGDHAVPCIYMRVIAAVMVSHAV